MPLSAMVAIGVVAVIIILIIIFKVIWRVAEPNEALIISGFGAKSHNRDTAESLGFKIVTGKGVAVLPGFQAARRLNLDTRTSDLDLNCVTKQGIQVHVLGVVIYKIGDDFASIANAARRFLDQQKSMDDNTHQLFAGHLRSIVGNLTVEDLLRNREELTSQVRTTSATEMSKLGLVVDSLQIQDIVDASGYIDNLGKPDTAKVDAAARVAEAEANQEATEAEQQAEQQNSGQIRDTEIKKKAYQGQIDQAAAEARQQVILKETRNAELEADRKAKELESDVRKPADAKAYETVTLAEAQRQSQVASANAGAEAIRVRGSAEAEATRVKGVAEADAIAARAKALAENQEAVIAQQLADNWPEIAAAGAQMFSNIDNMTVLNGAEGIEEMLAKALTLGGAGLGVARQLLGTNNGQSANGHSSGTNGDGLLPKSASTIEPKSPEE